MIWFPEYPVWLFAAFLQHGVHFPVSPVTGAADFQTCKYNSFGCALYRHAGNIQNGALVWKNKSIKIG